MSQTSVPLNPRSRATICDVAALAGVGIKTVSGVSNEQTDVSIQARERVQRAITALNYQPRSPTRLLCR